MPDILFIALDLDQKSRDIVFNITLDLLNSLDGSFRPKFIGTHSTISFHTKLTQEILDFAIANEGKVFPIIANGIGVSDKAIALKCNYDAPCSSNLKHITLATNIANNGKPVDSNYIVDWEKIHPVQLSGKLTIYYKNRKKQ